MTNQFKVQPNVYSWIMYTLMLTYALFGSACSSSDDPSVSGGSILGGCIGTSCEDDNNSGLLGPNDLTRDDTGVDQPDGGLDPVPDTDPDLSEPDTTPEPEPEPDTTPEPEPEPDTTPEPEPEPEPEDNICDGDARSVEKVFFGTLEPTYLPLTEGQMLSVGNFYGCTGLLIAPTWVLSASHCGHRRGSEICFGRDPSNANICFRAINVYEASDDMALLELETDVTQAINGITPIPLLTEDMDRSWVGRTGEASGYGQTETGSSGTRKFTAQPIVRVSGNFITIDGEGERGVCFGDSGGPLMVIASDGTVRIAGVLSGGDGSCVGRDNYTRVDVFRDWIESYTGPTVVEGASCGEVDDVGRCLNNQALWCDGEQLRAQTCDGATSCGWDEDTQGYRCILGDDPCQGIDAFGQCNGQTALWCDRGQLRSRDCGSCDQTCSVMTEYNGVYCEEDPCRGLDYYGQCDGNVVEYCDDGQYRAVDCASEGLRCVWFNERVGYWCN